MLLFCTAAFGGNNANCVITGTIHHHTVKTITIDEKPVPVGKDGSFRFEPDLSRAETLTLRVDGRPVRIHAAPGARITVTFDERQVYRTLRFGGDFAAINRYLLLEDGINDQLAPTFRIGQEKWVELFKKDDPAFLNELKGFRERFEKALKSAGVTDQAFLSNTRTNVKLAFGWLILQYPHFHEKYTGTPTHLSSKATAYLDAVNVDDPTLIGNDEYTRFTKDRLYPRIRKVFLDKADELKRSDNQWLVASLDVVSETFSHPDTRAYWQYVYLMDYMDRNGIKDLGPFIQRFNRLDGHGALKRTLNAAYAKEMEGRENHPVMVYKRVNGFSLDAHVFMPEGLKKGETRPAVVFFHGGSWSEGKPDWQFGPSPYGFVKVCIEYRTYDRYRALPTDAVEDAKSAIRWVRRHAGELHVDPNRIIASGNSAGGHLALCTAMVEGLDGPGEDLSISACPNALILTSAVYGLDENVWFADKLKDPGQLAAITPLKLVRKGLPPMLIFHGTADVESAPYPDCTRFVKAMKAAGNTVDFHPIPDKGHFLWRYGAYWQIAKPATKAFLQKLGYLNRK